MEFESKEDAEYALFAMNNRHVYDKVSFPKACNEGSLLKEFAMLEDLIGPPVWWLVNSLNIWKFL